MQLNVIVIIYVLFGKHRRKSGNIFNVCLKEIFSSLNISIDKMRNEFNFKSNSNTVYIIYNIVYNKYLKINSQNNLMIINTH